MKLDPGQSIQILANVGVVAGIVFLVVELQQNNELMASQARFNRLSVATETMTLVAESPDIARFLVKSNNGEELAPEEDLRLENYHRRIFFNMQWTYREVPESSIPIEGWRMLVGDPAKREFWLENKTQFNNDPEFVQWIDENLYGTR